MNNMTLYIISLSSIFIFIASYLLVAGIRSWADRKRILDVPNERSSHDRPIPRGGGISIVSLTMGGIWLFYVIDPALYTIDMMVIFTIGAIIIAGISLLDDLYSIRNGIRFIVHGIAATGIIWKIGFFYELPIPFFGNMYLEYAGIILTFLFIVGLTNAYNFMDGIDGIAGIQAIIAGIGWAVVGYIYSVHFILILALLIAASSAGFLFHNWHPAKIFMGDVGSAFLGFTFAAITMIAVKHDPLLLYAGILLLWPFIFDTVYTFLRRILHKENIFEAHRSHLYQRLVIAGWGHCSVTILYGILACSAWIPIGLMLWKIQIGYLLIFTIPVLLFIFLVTVTSRYEKRYTF